MRFDRVDRAPCDDAGRTGRICKRAGMANRARRSYISLPSGFDSPIGAEIIRREIAANCSVWTGCSSRSFIPHHRADQRTTRRRSAQSVVRVLRQWQGELLLLHLRAVPGGYQRAACVRKILGTRPMVLGTLLTARLALDVAGVKKQKTPGGGPCSFSPERVVHSRSRSSFAVHCGLHAHVPGPSGHAIGLVRIDEVSFLVG